MMHKRAFMWGSLSGMHDDGAGVKEAMLSVGSPMVAVEDVAHFW